MNYAGIYMAIAHGGYNGIVCMEYLPLGNQTASLIKAVDAMRTAFAS